MRTFSRRTSKASGTVRNQRRRERYLAAKDKAAVDAAAESEVLLNGNNDGEVLGDANDMHIGTNVTVGDDGDIDLDNERSDAAIDRSAVDGRASAEGDGHSPLDRSAFVIPVAPTPAADRSAAHVPDRSGIQDDSWSALSPKTKNACVLANWQATRGHSSDNAMADLLENVIPQLDTTQLPTWRQVPGLVFAADGYRQPVWHEFIVCKTCGVTKDETLQPSHCPWCTTRATIADSWVSQGCTIMHLADIVASWFRNPADADALLAYLDEPEVMSTMTHSPRARRYYELLREYAKAKRSGDDGTYVYVSITDRSVSSHSS